MPKNKEGRKIYDCQRPNALPHPVRYAALIDGQEPLAGSSSATEGGSFYPPSQWPAAGRRNRISHQQR